MNMNAYEFLYIVTGKSSTKTSSCGNTTSQM